MLDEQSLFFLIFLVFALGVRHGFDLDHLATIDAITRTVKENQRLSKFVGFLFSLGHGVIVICMAWIMSSGMVELQSTQWLEWFGHWVSVFFLLVFGLLTLWRVLFSSQNLPTGLGTFIFKKILNKTANPLLIILIGALFAVSFDTITQVALFSISATVMMEYFFPLILGLIFMLGMMMSDGLNGWVISSLLQRADNRSSLISRSIGLIIAGFSLILGIKEIVC